MAPPRPPDQPDDRPSSTPTWAGPVESVHMMQPQNVVNASSGRAPIVNVTVNTPTSPQDYSEVIVDPVVTARADHEVYSHQLLSKKRGFPLWSPGPGRQHPVQYRRQGTSIGDVGIITPTGRFDFLFNIFLPADHPINIGRTPRTFSPLPREQLELDIDTICDFNPGSYLTSSSVRNTSVQTTRWFSLGATPLHQLFESTSGEAAILTMPDGASTQDLRNTLSIRRCISENAENWYEYVTQIRGRSVEDGDIRVVVGIDKVKSWGIATATCHGGQTASLTFRLDSRLNRTRYCWDCTGGSGRVGPPESEICDLVQDNITPENQCIFVRTMNFTLSGKVGDSFPSEAVLQPVNPMSGQGDPAANRGRPEGGQTSAGARAGASSNHQTRSTQGTSRLVTSVIFDTMQRAVDCHPSAAVHAYLHDKFPDAKIVITEDSDWISVVNNDETLLPEPEELVKRILKSFDAVERDGIVTICMKPNSAGVSLHDTFPDIAALHRDPLNSGISVDLPRRASELFDGSRQPKRRMTDSGPSAALSQSKKQRIGDFMQNTSDIAKYSPDFGNPLKAALAGVSALVEHYEEFEGVKDNIEGLLPQLNRLTQNVTTTINEDPDETRRQSELISALRDIGKRSQELLEKGMTSQFADKGRDSAEVARLVERFREAVIHYQISQRQAIYDQITDLTSSFNTLKLRQTLPAVKNKLEPVMARLDRLCSAEDIDDDNGYGRQAMLFNTLRLIRDNGNKLYDRINAPGYNESEDDIQAVFEIAGDIRDALLAYQLAQQLAIYDQNCKSIDAVDQAVLNNCRRARGAAYQGDNRRGCLRGTREVVLDDIEAWTKDFNKLPVFWLNGLAGTGKSTIAQTVAERAYADGLLGASFFCSRDIEDRSDLRFIFPTLAFQLAHKFPSFRAPLVSLLQSNPDVVGESLYTQMERLIVEPLRSAEVSTLIVIDALDECKDDEPSSAILSVLGRLVEQIPGVKFFITGRPEPRIETGFRLPLIKNATKVFALHGVHPDVVRKDIQLFLKHELSELSIRHRLEGWPRAEHIRLLCKRAAGLFVYAVATIKFLDCKSHPPERRLEEIVSLPECTVPEGRTTLDSLYMSVLQMAFSEEDPEVDSKVRSIIGAVVLLVNPLPPSGIAELTQLDPREVVLLLTSVQSLLILDEDPTQPVKSFHKSFPDFVADPSRCNDTRFYITPEILHLELAINCLVVLNNGLEHNLLNLPDYALNSEVKDLQTRIDGRMSVALRYACQSWHNHLARSRGDTTDVISRLRFFLEKKFLAWLEVLSVLKATRVAVVTLEKLMVWLQKVSGDEQLLNTARDSFYFVTGFFEPINVSAAHIRHSALELSPLSSSIRKLYYHQRLTAFPRVEIGIPDSREPSTAIFHDELPTKSIIWSPDGQFVAMWGGGVVKIQDALTFELVSTLQPPSKISAFQLDPPSYSPDGQFLACITPTEIVIWDIQTGGVAKRIECNLDHKPLVCREPLVWPLVWSSDGEQLAVLADRTVNIYDVASGSNLSSIGLPTDQTPYLWAYNTAFRVMTTAQESRTTTIDILEIGSIPTLTKIESFSIQLEGKYLIRTFSPTTYRLSGSVGIQGPLLILDIRTSGKLLLEKKNYFRHTFSPDGTLFAASEDRMHIWKYDGGFYVPWRHFSLLSGGFVTSHIQFSPAASSILVQAHKTLRIWRLDSNFPTALCGQRFDLFSRSGTHIAAADHHQQTIHLLSRSPSQFIDTGVDIVGLGLTGNVLLVKGPSVIVAWLLTEEGRVSNVFGNRRVGPGDSIWTIPVSSMSRSRPKFSVEGETGVIRYDKIRQTYSSRTGEVLSARDRRHFSDTGCWYSFDDNLQAQDYRSLENAPAKYKWKRSDTTWSWTDGWLKDLEGNRLLWLPTEWRMDWRGKVEWFPNISMLKILSRDGKPILIKLH